VVEIEERRGGWELRDGGKGELAGENRARRVGCEAEGDRNTLGNGSWAPILEAQFSM
jgi:hypothetical protein